MGSLAYTPCCLIGGEGLLSITIDDCPFMHVILLSIHNDHSALCVCTQVDLSSVLVHSH